MDGPPMPGTAAHAPEDDASEAEGMYSAGMELETIISNVMHFLGIGVPEKNML